MNGSHIAPVGLQATLAAMLLIAGVPACGIVDTTDTTTDAASSEVDATGPTDAATDAQVARCNRNTPFGSPVALATINTAASEESPVLTPDELTMYFSSTRTGTVGGYDVFVATRDTTEVAFGSVMPVPGLNTAGAQRVPQVTADGLNLYALTGGSPDYQISVAQRSDPGAAFGPLAVVATINSASNDEPGSVLPDHSALYFDSNRGGNGYDLYRAPRAAAQFSNPLPISGDALNTPDHEAAPIVTPDELTLFFASNRSGGIGDFDIYMTTRTSTANGFGAPTNLQVLNSPGLDIPSWVSADGCVLYLTRGPVGAYDIYVATRGL
jgi:OOP family OmpA-OmpF porin